MAFLDKQKSHSAAGPKPGRASSIIRHDGRKPPHAFFTNSDFKPIAHLYKTQVYALAAYLGVPREIQERAPTTDTFSMPQSQEEFYFALPYRQMDLCLWAYERGRSPQQAAELTGLDPQQVERVYRDIEAKRRAADYLHYVPDPLGRVAEG